MQTKLPLKPGVQEIAPGITMEYLEAEHIHIFTIRTVNVTSLAAYEKKLLEILGGWPADRPFAHIQDFADPSIGFTPAVQQITKKTRAARPDLKVTVGALVVPRTVIGQLVQLAIRRRKADPKRIVNMFYRQEDALAWLRAQLKQL